MWCVFIALYCFSILVRFENQRIEEKGPLNTEKEKKQSLEGQV